MTYVEGFLTPVPTAKRDAYLAHATAAAPMLKELGVRRMVESWGDDVPRGKLNDLWMAVEAGEDETVVFSWFEYPDRAARDAAGEKMMSDPRMEAMMADMPFDGRRMVMGGFTSVSDVGDGRGTGYIDGIVLPVKTGDREAFGEFARSVGDVFLEFGALRVMDTVADDVQPGERTDFFRAIRAVDGEDPSFGWVEWPDKATRDAGWNAIMTDPRMQGHDAPFDGKRMIFGGFTTIVDI